MNKQHGKWLEWQFSDKLPGPKVPTGLKLVLWKITDNSNAAAYDWGFALWEGNAWESIEVPAGFTAEVVWWSEPLDPSVLLTEPSKIIKLN